MDRSRPARLRRVLVAAVIAVLGTFILIPGTASAAGTGAITGSAASASTSPGPARPTAPRSSSRPATAPTHRTGPWAPTARSGRSASAWTSPGGSTANGAKVQLWDCNGTGAQVGRHRRHDIVNPQANKCLDATGPSSADGTRLQIWACTGGAQPEVDGPGRRVIGRLRGQRGPVQPDVPEPELLLHLQRPDRGDERRTPAFATTGSDTVKKQEAAAFLANVSHETGGLVYIDEIDKSGNYCDAASPTAARPALRLLRPRPDPAELELQLQGRR